MRTKKTTKPAPNLAASSNGDSKPERTTKLLTTNGKAGENEEDPADSVILIDNDSLVSIAENGNVEKADGSESEKDDEATSSHKANDKAGSADDKTDSGTKEPTKIIRLVSIEKLMRPNLLPTTEEETSKKKSSHKKTTIEKLSNKRAKDTSVIEISDTDNEDDNKPLFKKIKTDGDVVQNLFIDDSDDEIISIKKKVFPKATKASKKLIDDDEDEEEDYQPVVKGQLKAKAAKSKPKQHAKVPEGCKSFSLRVEKLPSDLKSFMKEHKLSGILDRKNREITTFKPNTNHYGDFIRKRNASGAGSSKSKAQDGKKSMSSKSLVILSSESEEADSDEPIANMVSKSDNIPKNKTMSKRSTRSKRQLNGSDDDGDSDGDFEIKTVKSKATFHERSRRQREMRQARRRKDSSEEEEEDEEENDKAGGSESDDFEEDKPQPKKKRSRIKKVSSSSSDDDDGNKTPTTSVLKPQAPNRWPSGRTLATANYLTVLDMSQNDSDKVHPKASSPRFLPAPEESKNLRHERFGFPSRHPTTEVSIGDKARALMTHPPSVVDRPNSEFDRLSGSSSSHLAIVKQLHQYIVAQNRQIEELTRENRKLRAAYQQAVPSRQPVHIPEQPRRGHLQFYHQQANDCVPPFVRVVLKNVRPKHYVE